MVVLDGSDGGVILVVSLELEVGLVDAVVFKLPLVFSFVVLGLEVELVVPYGEDVVALELVVDAEEG